jgi:signal peptidase I
VIDVDGVAEGRDDEPLDQDPDIDAAEADAPTAGKSRLSKGARSTIEWVVVIGAALIVALFVRTFLLAAFYIPSESMESTLNIGDRVLVNKLATTCRRTAAMSWCSAGRRESDATIKDLIKRVVALPGETVSCQNQKIVVDGRTLDEPYLDAGVAPCGVGSCELRPQTVPPNFIWVMGDNRGASQDSRCFGPISQKLLVGRAFVRGLARRTSAGSRSNPCLCRNPPLPRVFEQTEGVDGPVRPVGHHRVDLHPHQVAQHPFVLGVLGHREQFKAVVEGGEAAGPVAVREHHSVGTFGGQRGRMTFRPVPQPHETGALEEPHARRRWAQGEEWATSSATSQRLTAALPSSHDRPAVTTPLARRRHRSQPARRRRRRVPTSGGRPADRAKSPLVDASRGARSDR